MKQINNLSKIEVLLIKYVDKVCAPVSLSLERPTSRVDTSCSVGSILFSKKRERETERRKLLEKTIFYFICFSTQEKNCGEILRTSK